MSREKTKKKVQQGIQSQLKDIPTQDEIHDIKVSMIDRKIESLKNILISMENLNTDEKKRVFCYLKNRYATSWPSDNY